MGRVVRKYEIQRRRRRRNKIKKIRTKLAREKNTGIIEKLISKLRRIHPFYPMQNIGK